MHSWDLEQHQNPSQNLFTRSRSIVCSFIALSVLTSRWFFDAAFSVRLFYVQEQGGFRISNPKVRSNFQIRASQPGLTQPMGTNYHIWKVILRHSDDTLTLHTWLTPSLSTFSLTYVLPQFARSARPRLKSVLEVNAFQVILPMSLGTFIHSL